jgi:hypothetical protein
MFWLQKKINQQNKFFHFSILLVHRLEEMGQQKDSKEIAFKFVQGNDSKIEYIKSFSSSELTGTF